MWVSQGRGRLLRFAFPQCSLDEARWLLYVYAALFDCHTYLGKEVLPSVCSYLHNSNLDGMLPYVCLVWDSCKQAKSVYTSVQNCSFL